MNNKSKYVIMKVAPESVGGFTHHRDWDKTEKAGHNYCDEASGMTLCLWDREQYEQWHKENIMTHYQ